MLEAAERIVERAGPAALSVRGVADAVDVSTRALYSTFGSKAGLLDALARRAYTLLVEAITALPTTDDPVHDVVAAATEVFRPMAVEHPWLFRLAFLRAVPELETSDETAAVAAQAFSLLRRRFERLSDAGMLGGRDARACAAAYNALCEGLATSELRLPRLLGPDPVATWRQAVTALVVGFGRPDPAPTRAGAPAAGAQRPAGR